MPPYRFSELDCVRARFTGSDPVTLLQIENEYYSSIRPKQLTGREEKPSLALQRRGVRYLELRSLDVNVYHPLGVDEQQLHFLEAFLIFCLLQDSPAISGDERKAIDKNLNDTAHRGRAPELQLNCNGNPMLLSAWGLEICEAMEPLCQLLDEFKHVSHYSDTLGAQVQALQDADQTPSARILAEMRQEKEAFFPFSMRYSQKHYQYFHSLALPPDVEHRFNLETEKSLQQQRYLESSKEISFDEYLERYFAQR